MDKQNILKIIKLLEDMYLDPYVNLGTIDPHQTRFALQIIKNTCTVFDVFWDRRVYQQVVHEYGWEYNANGALPSILAKGMTDLAATQELLRLEIETWRRINNQM